MCRLAAGNMLNVVACRLRHRASCFHMSNSVAGYPSTIGSVRLVAGNMEWSIERTIMFIDDFHNSPELWNVKNRNYKDKKIRNDKLKELTGKYKPFSRNTLHFCDIFMFNFRRHFRYS